MLLSFLNTIPEGYSEGIYREHKYSLTKTVFNKGKSIKLYARDLQGNDFISLNYYLTSAGELLKPCEMPKEKVIDFLQNIRLL